MKSASSLSVIAVTIAAVLLAVTIVAIPIVWAKQLHASIASHSDQLAALTHVGRAGSVAGEWVAAGDPLLTADSLGTAGALLQQKLDDLALSENVQIRTAQVLPPRSEGDLVHVALSAELQASTPSLRSFLYALETGFPLLMVDEITVRAAPLAADATQDARLLDISITVHGLSASREEGR